ncbi:MULTISPECIES: radical SAM family heme chaperone HemW [unclassified Myxococcus]|uniref:radical SAM family heme chaperone HemW n=1 Tax=Myxococcus TaxID=32 RepID=UPI001CC03072|nr:MULTISPECIES: radical SAM family heme chaperone HemW [unclassified Myxococcus]MBZ4397640.1 radical SAM family heme chaperone HemW [Myxococcus sp. AS-1-15]MBZ4407793.1 radical SAM family heme chaperone HemW [Myxococcus sp. XM-1-1-1]BDT31642.1 radical SAM family heme chaperone HemW [Myxococcus sp. MH1]
MPFDAPVDLLTGMPAARFGLYLHFPYCLAKCPYCDFAVAVARQVPEERYANAVLAELDARLAVSPGLRDKPLESIFLGGGTPSLWHPRYVSRVLDGIAARLKVSPGAEVSLEGNPERADAERFEGYRAAGVNRLSLGVQSFEPRTLKALGRAHDAEQVERAVELARRARFPVVSMDFIYGVHGQTVAQVEQDARRAVALQPEHLSTYALTVEREVLAVDTPLSKQLKRGELELPSDDDVVTMAATVRQVYGAAGLTRYEVSNHARAGFSSRHNALYWTGGEYLALGVGATGMLLSPEPSRYANLRSPERYLAQVEAGRLPEDSREALGAEELFAERLAMGLRLVSGVDWEAVCERYGQPVEPRRAEVARLVEHGFATLTNGRLALTEKGADVHSAVCARLL